jgi:eukaryotic-like serine/threonine-protein kinase
LSISPIYEDDWSQRYTFSKILAQGGMGIIYLAEDKERNNTPCVIKQLIIRATSKYDQEESVRLFKREAEVLKFLDHPGIVHLIDSHATEDGHYFLVMDLVPGKSIDELLRLKGTFSSQATVEIAIQCCEVLEYLHKRNPPIIYRDLKPSNLMLTPEGHIVFIDFGIARALMPQAVTMTRVVTTGYSPPEQYYGKPEFRSDLYALGATMFQMLTGVKPKPLLASSPAKNNSNVLPSLDNLVRRLTATATKDRPVSAQYLRYELYHIYHEIDPDFVIPEEAKLIEWQKETVNEIQPGKETIFKRLWQGLFNHS